METNTNKKNNKKCWTYKRPTVLLDFDDVLSDTLPHLLAWLEKDGVQMDAEQITSWNLGEFIDPALIARTFREEAFWRTLPEKDGAFGVVQRLINDARYDIFVGTATSNFMEFMIKVERIRKEIPGFNIQKILPISEKSKFRADVIVDDKLATLIECRPFMHCVVMDMPHNRACPDGIQRISSLQELPDVLERMFF